jgi:hypothetical protein
MKSPFVLHSNISGKERVSIRKEDLDKLTDEDWAELKRRNVHICIIGLAGDFKLKQHHPTAEKLDAQLKKIYRKTKFNPSK